MMVGWIARTAVQRGRNPIGWTLGGAAIGAAGFGAGFELFVQAAEGDSTAALLAAGFAPTALMLALMAGFGFVLLREPVKVSSRKEWPVHVMTRGEGTLRIAGGSLELTWKSGSLSRPMTDVDKVEPDGECVRITVAGEELAMLPMGKPESREGRIAQSRTIALQVRAAR